MEASERQVRNRPPVEASGIGEYIHFECCPRYFKLRFEGDEERKSRAWGEAFRPLSPLLYGAGTKLEETTWEDFRSRALEYHDLSTIKIDELGWDEAWERSKSKIQEVVQRASNVGKDSSPIILYQVPVRGRIGIWEITGIADLVAIWPQELGRILIRVFEVKASWKERTYHRIQVAIYSALLNQALKNSGIRCQIEGGIILRKFELDSLSPDSLPSFNLAPLIEDLSRLMGKNGELNGIHMSKLSEIEYRLSGKCENCIYSECCFTRSTEEEDIRLLNLSRGEQKVLRKHGVETLTDLAGLKLLVERSRPDDFREVEARDSEKVEILETNPVIGAKLNQIVQRAQFMLNSIKPGHEYANNRATPPWITGTGYGRLPEDNPRHEWNIDLGFPPGSLIRVYLHVEWDYMLDRVVMISGRVNCTRYKGQPLSISKLVESLPDEPKKSLDMEKKLLEAFFTELSKAIQRVAENIGCEEEALIHLYFYTGMERDRLMDAVRRQRSLLGARAVRDLLGLRQAIDQPMVSIVQDEVIDRKALKYPSSGLLPVLEQCYHPDEGWFNRDSWTVRREDGKTINLRKTFYHGFFNYSSPYRHDSNGSIQLMLERGAFKRSDVEGYYPIRAQFGSQIPLEYIWAAKGRLDPSQARGYAEKKVIEKCMWHDDWKKDERITDEDIRLLGVQLCHAVEHIERSLEGFRNLRLGKRPINVPNIEQFTLGEAELCRGCREYLDLEYFSRRQQLYEHYALLPRLRVETGRSVVFECTDIEANGEELRIIGRLIYDELGFSDIDQVVNACRVKGSDGLSSGDWMVATEAGWNPNGQLEEVRGRSPSHIERSARVIVETIDPRRRRITLKVISWPSRRGENYFTWHNLPTTDPAKVQEKGYMELFEEGRIYILDEQADDIVANRASKALAHVEHNPLYITLDDFLNEQEAEPLQALSELRKPAREFLRWLRTKYSLPPNEAQIDFIETIWKPFPISTLQGPPGTGKTENLHWAVLAHTFAHTYSGGRCRVLMVGPTHKSIYEFVSKLAKCWMEYQAGEDHLLNNLRIIRVVSKESTSLSRIEGVEYINYHDDPEAVSELGNILRGQLRIDRFADHALQPIIICATPAGMYGLMKKIGGDEPPWGSYFFDLLAVDEASMMRLPDLILAGAFVRRDAQVLMAGDHRQLPPVQVHDWEKEDRRTIEEIAPFLSAQDFIRFLKGDDLGLEYLRQPPEVDIPMAKLEETFRCHPTVAEFLRKWVYSRDGICFSSKQDHTISQVNAPTEGLRRALDPNKALVLILHDERESFQSNPIEVKIVRSLIDGVRNENIGVVTPHNAQRGLLRSELGDDVERIATVERFQGGQNDFIIISATVSDPDYIRAESDFLLNLNRLNVAMSRMRKKLVVIASKSIFEYIPKDARDYDKAILWRGLLQEVGAISDREPDWDGTLPELLGKDAPNIRIKIYAK